MHQESWNHARAVLRTVLIVLGVGALLWLGYALQGVLLLVLLSVFFAYLLAPGVEMVHRLAPRLGRAFAVIAVYVVLAGVAVVSLYVFLPHLGAQLEQLSARSPEYAALLKTKLALFDSGAIARHLPEPLRSMTREAAASVAVSAHDQAQTAIMQLLGALRFLPWFVLVPAIAFFLIKDAHAFRRSALQMLPQGRVRWRGQEFFEEVNRMLASYVRAQLLACAFIGVTCSIGFVVIGLPYGLVVGLFAGFAEFIPVAGPLITAILASTVAMLSGGDTLVATVVFLIVLRMVQDYVVFPRLIGNGVNMHPLAIILAILCGSHLLGFTGLFVAIPVTAIFSVGYRHFMRNLGQDGLLAELLRSNAETDEAPAIITAPTETSRGKLSGLRVVVVDNESDALALLVTVLERAGATVAAASSAAEAYALVVAARPHVLVSDIAMPNEDGFDLIRHIRALPAAASMPAVALTGYAMAEDRRRAFAAGFSAHIAKPVDPNELVALIFNLAQRAPAFDGATMLAV